MSIHWVQQTATLYPVAVARKVDEKIREDHLVFISDDMKHDVTFVEECNDMINNYYQSKVSLFSMTLKLTTDVLNSLKAGRLLQCYLAEE